MQEVGSLFLEPGGELVAGDVFPEAGLGLDGLCHEALVVVEAAVGKLQIGVAEAVSDKLFVEDGAVGELDVGEKPAITVAIVGGGVEQDGDLFAENGGGGEIGCLFAVVHHADGRVSGFRRIDPEEADAGVGKLAVGDVDVESVAVDDLQHGKRPAVIFLAVGAVGGGALEGTLQTAAQPLVGQEDDRYNKKEERPDQGIPHGSTHRVTLCFSASCHSVFFAGQRLAVVAFVGRLIQLEGIADGHKGLVYILNLNEA